MVVGHLRSLALLLQQPRPRPNANMPSNTDHITLVAPRPVRLANFSIHLPSPHRHHSLRITSTPADPVEPLDDDSLIHLDPDSLSPKTSPRASPRSAPPSRFRPLLLANPLSYQVHPTLGSPRGIPFHPQTLSFSSPLPHSPPSPIPHLRIPRSCLFSSTKAPWRNRQPSCPPAGRFSHPD